MPVMDARRLADLHALYRLFGDRGRLLYVGISRDLARRLGEHEVKRWYPLVRNITVEWFPHEAAARVAETRAIDTERPRYNRTSQHPPKKVAAISRKVHLGEPVPAAETAETAGHRDLLADLDAVMENERIRLSELPVLLRRLAPDWKPYQKLTGTRLRAALGERGVRVVTKANVCRLNPADLRRARQESAA